MNAAELIEERDRLRAELARVTGDAKAAQEMADRYADQLARVTAELDGRIDVFGRTLQLEADCSALRARVDELLKENGKIAAQGAEHAAQAIAAEQRVAELETALRRISEASVSEAAWMQLVALGALARAESATPAKHPDTEIVDWMGRHAEDWEEYLQGSPDGCWHRRHGASAWLECSFREAVNAARKQGGPNT